MKETAITFNSEMVRAIQEGRKTQTRIVITGKYLAFLLNGEWDTSEKYYQDKYGDSHSLLEICPFGKPGDRLWCKETWCICDARLHQANEPCYKADGQSNQEICTTIRKWKSPVIMPREYSRITLEIVDVWVEKLNSISKHDAIEEGMRRSHVLGQDGGWNNYLWHGYHGQYGMGNKQSDEWDYQYSTYGNNSIGSFSSLWNLTHKKEYRWEQNPWVFAIKFKQII